VDYWAGADRILLCLRYGIGDLVMQTPVLEALRRFRPQARIEALGASPAIELLADDPRVDAVLSVHQWGLYHWGDSGCASIRNRVAQWLQNSRHDLVLDVSHAVAAVRDLIWSQPGPIFDADQKTAALALAAGMSGAAAFRWATKKNWGMEVNADLLPRLHVRPENHEFAARFCRLHGIGVSGPLLPALSPVASSPLKQWPVERFATVADWLIETGSDRVFILVGPQSEVGRQLLAAMRHPEKVVVIGAFHLLQTAALLERCAVLVCNDTGIMHMASAIGLPVYAVFGPTAPNIYLPEAETARTVGSPEPKSCPYRLIAAFGPAECLLAGRCRMGVRSCIDGVTVEEMIGALSAFAH